MKNQEHWSPWFKGTETEWREKPVEIQKKIAFKVTGCEVAYPTWPAPVECLHIGCRILRGELPKIALTNSILRAEKSNWLRFCSREQQAKIFRWYRKEAKKLKQYDPWKISWAGLVYSGIAGAR